MSSIATSSHGFGKDGNDVPPVQLEQRGNRFPKSVRGLNGDLVLLLALFIQFRLLLVFFFHLGGNLYNGDWDVMFYHSANITSSRTAFYRISPLMPPSPWLIAEDEEGQWMGTLEQRLKGIAQGRSQVWVIIDHNIENTPLQRRILVWLDGWGSRTTDNFFEKYELIGYSPKP